jgi:transcriptional regulator with XRE-family HTH domain
MTPEGGGNAADRDGLAERVERLRQLGQISARNLSKLAGASPNTVRNLVSGRTATLRGDILVGLARALGVTAEFLVSGGEESPTAGSVREALARAGYTADETLDTSVDSSDELAEEP